MNQLLLGDCKDKLRTIESNSVDEIVTDPPYGYSFMDKEWDKAIVPIDTWRECLRVLKPGAFAFVMCAPRQDVHARMVINLQDAGFKVDFTSIFWAYASGFPKASNISKLIDKKLGNNTNNIPITHRKFEDIAGHNNYGRQDGKTTSTKQLYTYIPTSNKSKELDGSYAGFQPKPAVEVILVVMKPLVEKNYVEQAMDNGKGITWLDDCRIPFVDESDVGDTNRFKNGLPMLDPKKGWNKNSLINNAIVGENGGRFPANILVSDDVLNDGKITKGVSGGGPKEYGGGGGWDNKINRQVIKQFFNDSGSFSRYFDVDAWQAQFLIVEKASKSEKNAGLELNDTQKVNDGRTIPPDNAFQRGDTDRKNTHPTVKPITLMSYLITMGSRKGDIILDPFCGSGTTLIAASLLKRNYIGIELNPEYYTIAENRLSYWKNKTFEKLEKIKKQAEKEKIVSMESFL